MTQESRLRSVSQMTSHHFTMILFVCLFSRLLARALHSWSAAVRMNVRTPISPHHFFFTDEGPSFPNVLYIIFLYEFQCFITEAKPETIASYMHGRRLFHNVTGNTDLARTPHVLKRESPSLDRIISILIS